ncbi:MAG TPA: WYL domain-containing protein [Actinomycetota bacterium]|nr:WYL domain-containing protein [Actinomycetota bacterium]
MANLDERFKRLLLLVPFVLKRPGVSLSEVCERFGISQRELIADLNTLFVCGLPGYGPGDLIEYETDGNQLWIRMADYFARPLRLTPAEGLLLYSGAKALAAVGEADPALDKAIERLREALGSEALAQISVGLEEPSEITVIRQGLESRTRIHLVYQSQSKDEVTDRDVDPWALFISGGRWYLVGWCHRVADERIFRLDRIRSASLLSEPAEMPEDFDLTKYRDVYVESADAILVTIDISPEASWVPDYYPLVDQQSLSDGWTRISLSVGGVAWLERLLLRLGVQARVVEPLWLGERVKQTACRMKLRYEPVLDERRS